MPKSSPVKSSTKAASSSAKSSPTDGEKKQTGYQKFCKENRDKIKAEFPDLKGKEVNEKLSEQWWESEDNPKRGNRPTKKPKKVKDATEKENSKPKEKKTKSKKEKEKEVEVEVEASSED